MNDKPIIVAALAVFVVAAAFPFWYTLGFSGGALFPELEPPQGALLFSAKLPGDDVTLEGLREEFENHQVTLSGDARLTKGEQGDQWNKWRIADAGKRYLVVRSAGAAGIDVYAGECVEDRDSMAENHMKVLIDWREGVIRRADRSQVEVNGEMYPKSLTKGCLKCHTNRETFCFRCHEYANALPAWPSRGTPTTNARPGIRCWNCHLEPKGD